MCMHLYFDIYIGRGQGGDYNMHMHFPSIHTCVNDMYANEGKILL